jgi:glycerol-3-phosphate dehydrogenase (NAD(P)+)
MTAFGVIGGGAWGTALAQMLASEGAPVLLWARESEVVESVNTHHENTLFLKGLALSPSLEATSDLGDLDACDALLVVTPAQHMRSVLAGLAARGRALILCSKGMEAQTRLLMSDVAAEIHPDSPIAVLSGPTFAHEVAAGLPAAVTLASADEPLGRRLAEDIARPAFRPYLSSDVIGAEIGGAVKNVLAIACGVVDGAGLGQNARAALISRGFAEMTRFGLAKGARAETLAGLAGLGDLVLTCSSTSSRNFSLGKGLGDGRSAQELLADRNTVAEGAHSAPVVLAAAREMGVDMPIVEAVGELLAGTRDVREVVRDLLARPLKIEG